MSPPRASCTSITSIRSLLIVAWTSPQRRRHSRPRKTQFRLILLSRLILRPGAVATLISLATTESPQKFCSSFGRLSFSCSSHGARRSRPLTPRLEWQDETEELLFSSSGRRRHSQPRRQGRAACAHQRTFSLSTRRTFSLSSDSGKLKIAYRKGGLKLQFNQASRNVPQRHPLRSGRVLNRERLQAS